MHLAVEWKVFKLMFVYLAVELPFTYTAGVNVTVTSKLITSLLITITLLELTWCLGFVYVDLTGISASLICLSVSILPVCLIICLFTHACCECVSCIVGDCGVIFVLTADVSVCFLSPHSEYYCSSEREGIGNS